MNQRALQLVTEALTSGEFYQIRGKLHNGKKKFCATGIICDVCMRDTKMGEWQYINEFCIPVIEGKSLYGDVNSLFYKWSGLNCEDFDYIQELNDGKRYSFPQIANYLNEKYGDKNTPKNIIGRDEPVEMTRLREKIMNKKFVVFSLVAIGVIMLSYIMI